MKRFTISVALAVLLLATGSLGQDEDNSSSAVTAAQQNRDTGNTHQKAAAKDETPAPRKYHLRLGMLGLTSAYTSGPFWYPYGAYGYYPYYSAFDPFWAPYYYPASFDYGADKGQIELRADPKDAAVYIDEAYAGTVQRLKNIWLDPGAYDLSIRAAGREPFQQRVYVLTGKTLSINAKLIAVNGVKEEKQ